ncbi:hypothetical protein J6590_023699 [Homalodisca vitripennis]|nr:hypothetical protein J6590_023699 [Homalodisca vitripennis]
MNIDDISAGDELFRPVSHLPGMPLTRFLAGTGTARVHCSHYADTVPVNTQCALQQSYTSSCFNGT